MKLNVSDVTAWFINASDEDIQNFLENGLEDLILDLESDDFFGTEGLNKRFA